MKRLTPRQIVDIYLSTISRKKTYRQILKKYGTHADYIVNSINRYLAGNYKYRSPNYMKAAQLLQKKGHLGRFNDAETLKQKYDLFTKKLTNFIYLKLINRYRS